MRRREFVASSALATSLSMSGCIGALGTDGGGGNDSNDNGNATEDVPADAYTLSVGVENPRYVVTTRSTYSNELNDAERVEGFEGGVRERVREAVDKGRATVEEPDDGLLEAVRDVHYVRDGDAVYAVDYSLPVYVLSGEEVDADEADEDRAVSMMDDAIRMLDVDNEQVVRAANTVVDRREGYTGEDYETTSLTPAFEEFVEGYDYISYPTRDDPTETAGYVEISLSEEDPDDYYLSAERLSHEEAFGVDEVRELGELSEDVADVVRRAVEDGYRGDTLPDGFDDATGDAYFLIDDEVHRPESREPEYDTAPVEVRAEVVEAVFDEVNDPVDEETLEGYRDEYEDAVRSDDDEAAESVTEELRDEYIPDGGATFTLSLANTSNAPIEVFSGAPAPFGVLTAENVDAEADEGRGRLVWSDVYAESQHVSFTPRGFGVNAIGLTTQIGAGDAETETYHVAFPPGEYRVEESVDVSRPDGEDDGETYPFTVVIEADETEA